LGHFEANIAPTDHDQTRWQVIEFQSLDMGERSSGIEAGHIWNGSAGSDVEEDFVRRQHTLPSVVQRHLKCFRRHKTPAPHDQFGAARFVVLQMPRNLTLNHFAFASANRGHIDGDRIGRCAVLRGMARQMGNLRARNLVLAGHTGDVDAGTPNPPPLHDGSPSP
jgi:hypothetical protein